MGKWSGVGGMFVRGEAVGGSDIESQEVLEDQGAPHRLGGFGSYLLNQEDLHPIAVSWFQVRWLLDKKVAEDIGRTNYSHW